MEKKLEKCTIDTYSLFLQIANEAFGKTDPEWFPQNCGHIFPFTDEKNLSNYVGNNYISYYNDEPSGTIGIYPIDIKCNDKVYKCAGIGAVGVSPDFRNLGIMDFMMNEVIKIIKDENYDLSWLVGERLRYKRFGYELGGKSFTIELNSKSFKSDLFTENLNVKTPKLKDWEVLDRLYKQYNNRVLRSRMLWERHIGRRNLVWKLLNEDAYLVYNIEYPKDILELAGDWSNVKKLLKNHMNLMNLSNITVSMPYESNDTIRKMVEVSSGYKLNSCDQFSLINENCGIEKHEITYCGEIFNFKNEVRSLPLYLSPIDRV